MKKEKIKNIFVVVSPLFGAVLIYIYKNFLSDLVPPCPIHMFTGLYCAGCGGTHSVYALCSGHIISALKYNAWVVGVCILYILWWIQNSAALFGKKIRAVPESSAFYLTFTGIALVYVVLRNFIPQLSPF